jgi:hypothetical protein
MLEMSLAGEDHRDAEFVGIGQKNYFAVFDVS